jgi:hypothetical protein
MTRVCGSNETVDGHGCMNLVSDSGNHCAAGHSCILVAPDPFDPEHIGFITENIKAAIDFAEQSLLQETSATGVEEFVTAIRSQPKNGVEWHQPWVMQFDAAEFYALGTVASVHYGDETIDIENEGPRGWVREDKTSKGNPLYVLTPVEFRKQFPDGKLPTADGENGWVMINHGWFALYQLSLENREGYDALCFDSLVKATWHAMKILKGET